MPDEPKDKLDICISFALEQLDAHREWHGKTEPTPFFLGINGVQGIGKTSLVSSIARTLVQAPHTIPTVVLSIDDFYLTHDEQSQLAANHPSNPLIQHRGQPSTHDLSLATSVLSSLKAGLETSIPTYDKSAFNGQGDRVPPSRWTRVNITQQPLIKLVILEGWCLGFRALDDSQLEACWEQAVHACESGIGYRGRLGHNRLEDVQFLNEALKAYDVVTDQLDALIHLDAEDTQYVYEWRLEQEAALRREKGSGMTVAEIVNFVNGYYPSYELFTERLRAGAFGGCRGNQLRLIIRKDRGVKEAVQL
ncbi:MAG: hypothetical protein Q9181_002083 [Wetmoreana brouardii]